MNIPNTTSDTPTQEDLLLFALEEAKIGLENGIKSYEIIRTILERVNDIENPNKALESELAHLVLNKTPPNGEMYNLRSDKTELAVPFFKRVYGRFYDAGILCRTDLIALDRSFLHLLDQYKGEIKLKTLQNRNDEEIEKLGLSDGRLIALASAQCRRRK